MVVIILGLAVLVFGLIFTKNVMCKGMKGVDSISDFTKSEIDRL